MAEKLKSGKAGTDGTSKDKKSSKDKKPKDDKPLPNTAVAPDATPQSAVTSSVGASAPPRDTGSDAAAVGAGATETELRERLAELKKEAKKKEEHRKKEHAKAEKALEKRCSGHAKCLAPLCHAKCLAPLCHAKCLAPLCHAKCL